MKKLIASSILTILSTHSVFAAGPLCQTNVLNTRVTSSGGLYLSGGSISNATFVLLCSVSQEVNGVTPDTCKSWQSILQTAQVASRNVDVSYKYADFSTVPSCGAVPAASNAPAPYFVQLAN